MLVYDMYCATLASPTETLFLHRWLGNFGADVADGVHLDIADMTIKLMATVLAPLIVCHNSL